MSALPSIAHPLELGSRSDAQAAADLYARHSGRIFGYCLGLLRNREEAEDAVQTTFLNAYRGLQRGVRPEFEAAWLFKIAQNVCRTRRERAWRRGRIEAVRDLDALQDVLAAPEDVSGQAGTLAEALKRMPERYRTIILLREWQGLSYREIASQLELSESAVEMLVFRARRSLAENLEQVDEPRTRALTLSSLVGFLKTLLGGAGLKTAVTTVVVTATAIAVSTEHAHHRTIVRPAHPAPGVAVLPVKPAHQIPHTDPSSRPAPIAGTSQRPPRPGPVARAEGVHQAPAPTPAAQSSSAPNASVTQPPPPTSIPETTPTGTVPAVSVPGTEVSTPPVSLPVVELPPPPSLPVSVPDLASPVDLPQLP